MSAFIAENIGLDISFAVTADKYTLGELDRKMLDDMYERKQKIDRKEWKKVYENQVHAQQHMEPQNISVYTPPSPTNFKYDEIDLLSALSSHVSLAGRDRERNTLQNILCDTKDNVECNMGIDEQRDVFHHLRVTNGWSLERCSEEKSELESLLL